jgi:hypothetical protein
MKLDGCTEEVWGCNFQFIGWKEVTFKLASTECLAPKKMENVHAW